MKPWKPTKIRVVDNDDDDHDKQKVGGVDDIPIQQIKVAEGWQHVPYEDRCPDAYRQLGRGSNYQQLATGYGREQVPPPTRWNKFMDTVAFPEQHVSPTVEYHTWGSWTTNDIKEAFMVACQDTVLCGGGPDNYIDTDSIGAEEEESDFDEY
eukprot:scaffold6205_cov92-Cylindrotheca_fusiformis.AAC.1